MSPSLQDPQERQPVKILILKPYAAAKRELELSRRVARADTELEFDNIEDAYPIKHVHHNYFRHMAIGPTVERIMRAEEEGFDGVCLVCGADPGLYEARELVDIPVTSTFESAGHIASMMGHKFSVLTTIDYAVPHMENLARLYGFDHKLASVRHLRMAGRELLGPDATPEQIIARVNEVARHCVEHDGAEVIVLTATLAGALFADKEGGPVTDDGVPVVNAMQMGVKMCELFVDLRRFGGLPAASRIGYHKEPYEPEYRKLREFYGLPLRRGLDR